MARVERSTRRAPERARRSRLRDGSMHVLRRELAAAGRWPAASGRPSPRWFRLVPWGAGALAPHAGHSERAPERRRLLLVGVHSADAELIEIALEGETSRPFAVTRAHTPGEALERLGGEAFDAILLDLDPGEGRGTDAFTRVHAEARGVPTIVLAGRDDAEAGTRLVHAGAQDYLIKGEITQALLLRSLRHALERGALEGELARERDVALEASRAKSQLLTYMSHEIRTPLNAILGSADLLLESGLSGEQQGYVRTFLRGGEALLHVIDGILDLSRAESGRVELFAGEFEIESLLEGALALVAQQARGKGLALAFDVAPQVPRALVGDANRLRQVLVNLLANAVKFTGAGEVRVRVQARDPGRPALLEFAVSDTGIGIPSDRLGAIFEPFTQADGGIAHRFGGTGLGLALSARLVELLGGRIWVESREGRGSTFRFTADLRCPSPRPAPPPLAPLADASPLSLLVADDSQDSRELLAALLADLPYRLRFAEHGDAAVEAYRSQPFDLVLMDTWMPGLDGLQATRSIREIERRRGGRRTPIIALTAHALPEQRKRCLEAGCDAHLAKPVRRQALVAAIERAAGKGRIAVAADPELGDLVQEYLERRGGDLGTLEAALGQQDFECIRKLGHDMRGTGSGYGCHGISEIGRMLEAAGVEEHAEAAGFAIERLRDYLDRVVVSSRTGAPA